MRRAVAEEVRSAVASLQSGEPKAPKALVEELKLLGSSIQSQEPNVRRAVAEEVRGAIASLQGGEQKSPKALVEELRSLSSAIQLQEPNVRRAVADEVRSAVATLLNAEPKVPKAILEEIRSISANAKTQESMSADHPSLGRRSDQNCPGFDRTLEGEALGRAWPHRRRGKRRYRSASPACGDRIGSIQQVSDTACFASRTRVASCCAASRRSHCRRNHRIAREKTEPAAVVFYDNVMLKKDQEKQYDEIGVRLSLQSVGSRQVRRPRSTAKASAWRLASARCSAARMLNARSISWRPISTRGRHASASLASADSKLNAADLFPEARPNRL